MGLWHSTIRPGYGYVPGRAIWKLNHDTWVLGVNLEMEHINRVPIKRVTGVGNDYCFAMNFPQVRIPTTIMAITATYPGANGKNKTWMTSSPPYWNPKAHQRHSVKTGLALSKKSMKLIPFAVLSVREK